MAETSVLRSSASPRPTSPQTNSASAHVQTSGPLPIVQVSMNNGKAQQTNGQGAQTPRNVVVYPPKNRLGTGPAVPQHALQAPPAPAAPVLSIDQLMLCRHLVAEYGKEGDGSAENAQLADATLVAIEQALADAQAIATRDQAIADQRAAAAARRAELAPAPVAPRQVAVGPRSAQLSSGIAPRRTPRAAGLPPVQVRMNGKDPVVEDGAGDGQG